jgi:hypothetical protein
MKGRGTPSGRDVGGGEVGGGGCRGGVYIEG